MHIPIMYIIIIIYITLGKHFALNTNLASKIPLIRVKIYFKPVNIL